MQWGRSRRRQLGIGLALALFSAATAGSPSPAQAAAPTPYAWTWSSNGYNGALGRTGGGEAAPAFALPDAVSITSGDAFTLARTSTGDVWGWGQGTTGQLGRGSGEDARYAPVKANISAVTNLATGSHHGIARRSDGTVWAWGSNYSFQLGYPTPGKTSQTPAPVPGLTSMTAVAAGEEHSLALASNGTVWAWGDNSHGQLGSSATTAPHAVAGISGAVAIFAGGFSSFALKADGTVWGWGDDSYGQLGDGGSSSSVPAPVRVNGISSPVRLEAGRAHAVALLGDGTVWAWGYNASGQLGDGTTASNPVPRRVTAVTGVTLVDAYANATVAVTGAGTVWQWGTLSYGIAPQHPARVGRMRSTSGLSVGLIFGAALAPTAPGITTQDGLLSQSPATVEGTAAPGAPVRVYEGATIVATATADGSGDWSAQVSLPDGAHELFATELLDGVESSESLPRTIVIDSTPPAAPMITAPAQGTRYRPALSGTAEPGSVVDVYEGAVRRGGAAVAGDGTWTAGVVVGTGTHTFTARATDAAGNTGPLSAARTFFVDATSPNISFLRPSNGLYVQNQEVQRGGNSPIVAGPLTVLAQIYDHESPVASVLFRVNGNEVDPSDVTVDGNRYSFTFQATEPGIHTIQATAANDLGMASGRTLSFYAVP